MNETQLRAWLALYFTPHIGAKRFAKLLAKGTPEQHQQASDLALQTLGFSSKQIQAFKSESSRNIDEALHWQQKPHRHIISCQCAEYPPLLAQLSDAPPLLFVEGDKTLLAHPQIAIVGSRHASPEGLSHAFAFARELVACDLAVTSGLALGIDGYVHDGALQAGGKTVAVLGSGLANCYPKRHQGLAQRIAEQGALVSEFAPKTPPRPEHFPRRNRVISGLALAVLVIEAAKNSGSLITARLAAEQGRDVFALPQSLSMTQAQGGNHLIQQGAGLVMSVQDIIEGVQPLLNWTLVQQEQHFSSANEEQQLPFPELFANVGNEATPVDILASRMQMPVQEVMMQLLELELLGQVVAVSGGYIRKGRGER
ncbi:DNA-protecting protein DprA [Vibrio sp. SM6]|uniref:DNA-protecting protein DprA n=1 Tax=Vibrio agarilyticus TaxID=2726741 RepID=A0A7X8YI91_9VIBR|nr:DNA-processing protein DprA [Vibrio agarilyticus]NLS14365.1 DNA-protecting protein DprA [Vibrio agarilyticus]